MPVESQPLPDVVERPTGTEPRRPPRVFERRLSRVGLVVGGLFFAASLTPSLLPRSGVVQGAVSGIALALGYGIGAGGSALWHYLQIPTLRGRVRRVVLAVLVGVIVLAVVIAQWRFVGWQNDQRRLFGMEPTSPAQWPVLAVVTLLVATLLLVIARALRLLFRTVIRWFRRVLPVRLANVLGIAVALLLVWGLVSGVLLRGFWAGANGLFAPQDLINKPGIEQAPTSALRTGGPGSAVSWDSLGREGRSFVVLGPTVGDLQKFSPGTPAKEPIRVYAGLGSADTVQGRADVVLRELQRTDAFSRKVLVLTTTTGSGFIQPGGVDPVEYLWHGDTAVVGVQYSYLPSWLSLLADQENVQQASQVVFETVYRYWSTLPADTRPRLYLYGLSLGSFGVQSVLTNIELLNQPINGALMVGPPFVNTLHQQLTAKRDPGSPVWRPVYQAGQTVRFTAQQPVLETNPVGPWGPTRVAYVQHGSDPVVWFSPSLFVRKPVWLQPGERAPDVSPRMEWYPQVTGFQALLDLAGAGGVTWGYGHLYQPSESLYGWSAVSQAPGWSPRQLAALAEHLDATNPEK
jgi:uncharacterized membrane protein